MHEFPAYFNKMVINILCTQMCQCAIDGFVRRCRRGPKVSWCLHWKANQSFDNRIKDSRNAISLYIFFPSYFPLFLLLCHFKQNKSFSHFLHLFLDVHKTIHFRILLNKLVFRSILLMQYVCTTFYFCFLSNTSGLSSCLNFCLYFLFV